jgi:hypothetical protein
MPNVRHEFLESRFCILFLESNSLISTQMCILLIFVDILGLVVIPMEPYFDDY